MGKVNFSVTNILKSEQGVTYIGDKNDTPITNYNAHLNSYFNIDAAQSAYFTMLIEGFEYNRYHTSFKSTTTSARDGIMHDAYGNPLNGTFDRFTSNNSMYWMPLKSLQYSQGSIETMSMACGPFADLQLPFRKHLPTMTVEMLDNSSDFFEMKLREWHAQSVLTDGFVPVLDSIAKKVTVRSWAVNGECNSTMECDCILIDDITTSRSYEDNGFKVIQFKLLVVGC